MIKKTIDSLLVYLFENLSKEKNVRHFVSTRLGGMSVGAYKSLNLGLHVGDDPQRVRENRKLLADKLHIPLDSFVMSKQIHGGSVTVVSQELDEKSLEGNSKVVTADAMITNLSHICLAVLVADCAPILFLDPINRAIGVAHAGWRGTVERVTQNTVERLKKEFGSLPSNLLVGIGPCIGPCCYEVGLEVVARVDKEFFNRNDYIDRSSRNGRDYFNLWQANKSQLLQVGIPEKNIEVAQVCTHCHKDHFFSERYQGEKTGRFGAGIMLE